MAANPLHTYQNDAVQPYMDPENVEIIHFEIPPSTTITKGTLVGELTANQGRVDEYDNTNGDGTETAIGIMMYDVVSDANGNITIGGGEHGETQLTCPVFVAGTFHTDDLTGLDAPAVADLGRMVQGLVADGILRIG